MLLCFANHVNLYIYIINSFGICLNYIIDNQHDTILHISFLSEYFDPLQGIQQYTVALIKYGYCNYLKYKHTHVVYQVNTQ